MKKDETDVRRLLNHWNLKSQKLSLKDNHLNFNEREIWFVQLGQNIGWEQNGVGGDFLRPALIVRQFNQNLLWVIPITRTIRSGNYFCTLRAKKCEGQLILPQMRPIDSVRLVKKIERIDQKQYNTILQLIRRLL